LASSTGVILRIEHTQKSRLLQRTTPEIVHKADKCRVLSIANRDSDSTGNTGIVLGLEIAHHDTSGLSLSDWRVDLGAIICVASRAVTDCLHTNCIEIEIWIESFEFLNQLDTVIGETISGKTHCGKCD